MESTTESYNIMNDYNKKIYPFKDSKVEITKEFVSQATPKWNKMLEENPKAAKVFKKYTKGDAKFYVVYHLY